MRLPTAPAWGVARACAASASSQPETGTTPSVRKTRKRAEAARAPWFQASARGRAASLRSTCTSPES
jgi:hypothetical protein